ncbi:winged helix-turn-helix transcriptional regulator [Lacisediminihabitans profunda]|uniref:Helix-turn-helix transcriptional regulator n=1 Tax=Lacisediminihabitans profunda TaxID=2594790 RepID=A0A5C8UQ40_9MICO|nr:helix-turn-helix domain-containing protein [Lacisediminihabitans profunda]TXN30586.1 helix-turn-helix transcriptional regulator [Lacisediminihabitans profunda]
MVTAITARNPRCSIARSLEVIGDKWTLLVVREAFWGRTRFADFRESLGVAPDVLTDRLTKLVAAGVFERRAYRAIGERAREEYLLTETGRALLPVLAALTQWGDDNRPTGFGPAAEFADARTEEVLRLAFINGSGEEVDVDHVALARGPGASVRDPT